MLLTLQLQLQILNFTMGTQLDLFYYLLTSQLSKLSVNGTRLGQQVFILSNTILNKGMAYLQKAKKHIQINKKFNGLPIPTALHMVPPSILILFIHVTVLFILFQVIIFHVILSCNTSQKNLAF